MLPPCVLFEPQKYSFVMLYIVAKLHDLSFLLHSYIGHLSLEGKNLLFVLLNIGDRTFSNSIFFSYDSDGATLSFFTMLILSSIVRTFLFRLALDVEEASAAVWHAILPI